MEVSSCAPGKHTLELQFRKLRTCGQQCMLLEVKNTVTPRLGMGGFSGALGIHIDLCDSGQDHTPFHHLASSFMHIYFVKTHQMHIIIYICMFLPHRSNALRIVVLNLWVKTSLELKNPFTGVA